MLRQKEKNIQRYFISNKTNSSYFIRVFNLRSSKIYSSKKPYKVNWWRYLAVT